MESIDLNCRTLLVENVPSQRFTLRWLLEEAGAEVETAANGQAALLAVQAAELEHRPYDVVLTDLDMPVVDGYTTLVAIRQLGHNMPVIAMSADNREGTVRRCQEAGFDAFVDKYHARERLVLIVGRAARLLAS